MASSAICAASSQRVRDGRVASGRPRSLVTSQVASSTERSAADRRQPALAQPVVQAGGRFHRRGDGQKYKGEGQHVVRGDQQRAGRAQAGQGGDGGNNQQVLAPGDRQAEQGEEPAGCAPASQVEIAWKRSVASQSSGERISTDGQAVDARSRGGRSAGVRAAQTSQQDGVEGARRRLPTVGGKRRRIRSRARSR